MLKLAVSNPRIILRLRKIPIVKNIVVFYLPYFDELQRYGVADEIFASLRYGDSTGKYTEKSRFNDLDERTVIYLRHSYAFHDVGVSSGVTSLDLLSRIELEGFGGVFTISDKYSEVSIQGRYFVRVRDSDNRVRSLYLFGVLCDPGLSRIFFLSRWLYKLMQRFPARGPVKHIQLFSDSVLRAIGEGRLTYIHYDVLSSDGYEKRFSFVRCMNLLNKCYFSEAVIVSAIQRLRDSLLDDGVLLLGRTDERGLNHASFYRRVGDGLVLLERVNGGAEVDALVTYVSSRSAKSSCDAAIA